MFFVPGKEGQGLVEYAFILLLVALAVILTVTIFGQSIGNVFSNFINLI